MQPAVNRMRVKRCACVRVRSSSLSSRRRSWSQWNGATPLNLRLHLSSQHLREQVTTVTWRCCMLPVDWCLTLYGHIKTAEQRTNIQQYGDWYTGCWWVGCYIWYSVEGHRRAGAPPSTLLAVPNVTAHPSTASIPTSYYSMWHYNCLCTLKC